MQEFKPIQDRLSAILDRDLEALAEGYKKYGESWRRKGGPGAYFTLSRKIDRYEHACEQSAWDVFRAIRNNPSSEGTMGGKDGLLDDIRDMRHYLALIEEFITREGYHED